MAEPRILTDDQLSDMKLWEREDRACTPPEAWSLRLLRYNHHNIGLPYRQKGYRSTHHFWSLCAFSGEEIVVKTETTCLTLEPGQLVLIPPLVPWEHPNGDRQMAYLHFEIRDLPGDGIHRYGLQPMAFRDADLHRRFHDWIRDTIRKPGPWVSQEAYALAALAISEMVRHSELPQGEVANGLSVLRPALDMIEEQYDRPLSLEDLAKALKVSPQYCNRLFRRHLGESPIGYLIRRRVAHAAHRLASGRKTLNQIALACGFPNRHYLGRVFKQVMGLGPGAYRRQVLGESQKEG